MANSQQLLHRSQTIMPNRFRFPVRLALACAFAILSTVASHAQSSVKSVFTDGEQEPTAINVLVGQSRVINFDKPIGRFSVSNPEIAEAVLVAPDQVLVNGKAFGQVNFI